MATFYETKREQAYRALAKRGALVYLRVQGGVFDPLTGELVESADTDHATYGLIFPAKKSRKSKSINNHTTWTVTLAALKTNGSVLPTPTPEMKIVFGDEVLGIAEVNTLMPGGVALMYDVEVVR